MSWQICGESTPFVVQEDVGSSDVGQEDRDCQNAPDLSKFPDGTHVTKSRTAIHLLKRIFFLFCSFVGRKRAVCQGASHWHPARNHKAWTTAQSHLDKRDNV